MSIPGLYATGVDDFGNALTSGDVDTHYLILETGTNAVVVKPSGAWLANDANSMWVWEQINGQPTNVTRTFRLTFDLKGLDPTTANIGGTWATDNTGLDILINGASTGNTSAVSAENRATAAAAGPSRNGAHRRSSAPSWAAGLGRAATGPVATGAVTAPDRMNR